MRDKGRNEACSSALMCENRESESAATISRMAAGFAKKPAAFVSIEVAFHHRLLLVELDVALRQHA